MENIWLYSKSLHKKQTDNINNGQVENSIGWGRWNLGEVMDAETSSKQLQRVLTNLEPASINQRRMKFIRNSSRQQRCKIPGLKTALHSFPHNLPFIDPLLFFFASWLLFCLCSLLISIKQEIHHAISLKWGEQHQQRWQLLEVTAPKTAVSTFFLRGPTTEGSSHRKRMLTQYTSSEREMTVHLLPVQAVPGSRCGSWWPLDP